MTSPHTDPASKLAALLEAADPQDRQEITAWLLRTGRVPFWPSRTPALTTDDLTAELTAGLVASPPATHARLRQLGSSFTGSEGSQLVTIRLPADRHLRLRDWCSAHGFTMATVVRGLVERFLTQEGATPDPDPAT